MAIINGDINDNMIDGTADADTINGFAGNDTLLGHLGVDTLNGSGNDDHLDGGDGADTLNGGIGRDILEGGAGADTLNGGSGIDVADYNGPAAVHVVIGGVSHGGDAEGDFVGLDVEDIWGTDKFGDELIGSAADNTLDGFGGNDTLYGLSGDDTLGGRFGDDLLVGGSGADRLFGGDGIDTADYGLSAMAVIVVIGGAGTGGDAQGDLVASDIENIIGSTKDDTLVGSTAANLLQGSFGKDVLSGWGGGDTLKGGDGDDTLVGGAGADDLDGGDGVDTADYGTSAAGVTVSLSPPAGSGGDAQGDTLTGIENLSGSDQDDQLFGDAGANILQGRGGDDLLRGVGGADTLIGGDGTDTVSYSLSSSGVTVSLVTGKGSGGAAGDTLTGIENLNGSQHNDVLAGNGGANVLQGSFGDDVLRGGAGADTFNGGIGIDTVSYFESSLSVAVSLTTGKGAGGDAQGDVLIGVETLSGSQANDGLEGDGWANTLQGWGGNDALVGGGGKDTLTGGAGADRFYFKAVTDSVVGAEADRITDFNHAQADRIDLTLIDANAGAAADQAFSFIGTALYSGAAGQLRYAVSGGVTTIAGDVNGDKVSDFHIQLTGAVNLVALDFVL